MDRKKLHAELKELLGSNHVYFQPPETIKLTYPCIIYELSGYRTDHSNDEIYRQIKSYEILIIEKDPDSDLRERVMKHFKYCSYSRTYTSDNLYHSVLNLYY